MQLPDDLVRRPASTPAWDAWLDRLPALVDEFCDRWSLTVDGEARTGYTALVLPVLDADGVRRACKYSFVEGDNVGEAATLQRWGGRGAVALLRADPRRGVMLLEWLGDALEARPDADDAARIVAGLYSRLHRRAAPQVPDGHAMVRGWLDALEALGRRVPAPPQLVAWALRSGRALASGPGTHLVHGDLHYLNVLDRGGEWVAIDPKGFNADPCFEVAPLLWNRWSELEASGDVGEAVRDRFYAVVDTAGLDERRARDWVVVRCMVNVGRQAVRGAVPGGGLADSRAWVTRNVTVVKAMQGLRLMS
ncbi:MAG: aminoglycoside phosphotransferase family protein [Actinomycetes bacterium]